MSPHPGAPDERPACPACGSALLAWELGPQCELLRCPTCGYIERDLGRCRAGARSEEYGGDPAADRVRLSLTARRIVRRVGRASSGRVLEIGSGDGQLAQRMALGAREVTAVDVRLPEVTNSRVRFLAGRFEEVDLTEGSFDLVVGVHVLEHVDDVSAVLRRVRRLLAPGGVGYFITPNAECASLSEFGEAWWMLEDPTHVRFLSARSATRLAAQAGFATTEVRGLLADSLAADGATIARRLRRGTSPNGVLEHPTTRALAVAVLPMSITLRALRPQWRPALEIVVR